ncbi:hypothetical protein C7974DRAFT_302266 [Boeremia exigua]|uniref:uncharacterized protein n=1 Tax=Boeremia exigua TaxID=749465 RepID=UPI001E8D31BD|nr:uncharacterized protein C7974DRAFT_302266 [Boeremia exigua]KAH6642402.1 hypothetical protein C7974DRAFT_302266 [Boeremia exigua]
MQTLIGVLVFFIFALNTQAGVTQKDYTGIGNIYVLNSSDWRTASPTSDRIGCLSEYGKLVSTETKTACGTFTRSDVFPYTLSTKQGNCTFNDESQERNTDSAYGAGDHAWNCNATYVSDIYDQLYTIDGFPHVFLCFGDVACYYDAKKSPGRNEKLSLWQYHWGSHQIGITPGHIQLLLLWDKIGELPKRKDVNGIPGPRVRLVDGLQIPLLGQETKL